MLVNTFRIAASTLSLLFCANVFAAIVDLGAAEDHVFASSRAIILGSEAHINGSVASSYHIGIATGAIIENNACAPSVSVAPSASISGDTGLMGECDYVSSLHKDIIAASEQMALLGTQGQYQSIIQTSTLNGGSTYWLDDLLLDSGETLSISGSAGSTTVINVRGQAKLGSGSSIELIDGIRSQDVLFNFVDGGLYSSFEVGAADISGTYLSNGRDYIIGDGATLNSTRFITVGDIIANVQFVSYTPSEENTEVSAPSMLFAFIAVAIVSALRRKGQYELTPVVSN
ncbi:hypothetical protein [Alteromonas sp. KUL49]|uniref:hypothetical protein n=1 Tax=Alteromonas sp. KUL49 TaxID=2480798 RepID=UPI00102EED12|nr:hypothetical protein [Alteromonas sp. KUL49]TAP40264.1 hypothetical protein EYS00_08845 [Alteromonas sp. KUL49]GEA11404.1 hypothetical protein KUL49_17790 [Alteromonas sp. KUL49]